MPFSFVETDLDGIFIIEPKVFDDVRGFFMETFRESAFLQNGINAGFVQDNHSFSRKKVLRGLHYQISPLSQAKLVHAISGAIFDVAVDLRKNSPTFMQWTAARLSDKNHRMLYIPEGFAHGFLCESNTAHVIYKCSTEYSPDHEAGIRWNDPELAIDWPVTEPILSEKDAINPFFRDAVLFGE